MMTPYEIMAELKACPAFVPRCVRVLIAIHHRHFIAELDLFELALLICVQMDVDRQDTGKADKTTKEWLQASEDVYI